MQNWIIGYADQISARCKASDVSIGVASEQVLKASTAAALEKLREAAADLNRIVELEQGRRIELEERAAEASLRPGGSYGGWPSQGSR